MGFLHCCKLECKIQINRWFVYDDKHILPNQPASIDESRRLAPVFGKMMKYEKALFPETAGGAKGGHHSNTDLNSRFVDIE